MVDRLDLIVGEQRHRRIGIAHPHRRQLRDRFAPLPRARAAPRRRFGSAFIAPLRGHGGPLPPVAQTRSSSGARLGAASSVITLSSISAARAAKPRIKPVELGRDLGVGERVLRAAARHRGLRDVSSVRQVDLHLGPALGGKSCRRGVVLAQVDRADRRARRRRPAPPSISAGPTLPRTSRAASGKGRLYWASSVAFGPAGGEQARLAEGAHAQRPDRRGVEVIVPAQLRDRLHRRLRPAADRVGFEILLQHAPALPRSSQWTATASPSIVSAGAPVKPSRASSAATAPAIAPQPEPSLTMVG